MEKGNQKKSTTPGIRRRSPIQVLIWPDIAYLWCSDGNQCFQYSMAVDNHITSETLFSFCPHMLVVLQTIASNGLGKDSLTRTQQLTAVEFQAF